MDEQSGYTWCLCDLLASAKFPRFQQGRVSDLGLPTGKMMFLGKWERSIVADGKCGGLIQPH